MLYESDLLDGYTYDMYQRDQERLDEIDRRHEYELDRADLERDEKVINERNIKNEQLQRQD